MQVPTIECAEGSVFHIPTPADYLFEILDPATGRPVPEGSPGLVTISHLNRRGTVLLRYSTGDMSALTSERCSLCGRAEPRFTMTPYRVSGLMKVKGTLINPATLHSELAGVPGLREYQIVVSTDNGDTYGLDVMTIRILCDAGDFGDVTREVARRIRATCEITPRVEPAPGELVNEIARGYKHRRVVDERRKV